ncbi:hypothetical protein QBC37DRAFT_369928 [Rhypophila decipiens]|uniref:Uncharacterized protein n=1 Tax=Rhypophila decipiens TaxID=261697 RepID=A0AAN6YDX2_9PEZI|nr:hypothetical protein QBC37DRAFT_369928 [Rhypophila decipiens]
MSMMSFATSVGGTNPVHGRDLGPAPPLGRNSMPAGMNASSDGHFLPGSNGSYSSGYMIYCVPYQPGMSPSCMAMTQYPAHANNFTSPRVPRALPTIQPAMPAANMTNSTGGVGCEPGYNYFFPPEHTKIVVIQTITPPWRLPANATFPMIACHISTKTTIAELMAGFGAIHPEKHKNTVSEVIQKGNGGWIKGLSFSGAEKKALKQTMGEVGWGKTRSGLPGEKPVVYLYFTRG